MIHKSRILAIAAAGAACLSTVSAAHAEDDRAYVGTWLELGKSESVSIGGYLSFAPDGSIDEAGKRVQAFAAYDEYVYDDVDGTRVNGQIVEFDVLVGMAFDLGTARITALAGPALVREKISRPGQPGPEDTSIGARLALESTISLVGRTTMHMAGHYRTIHEDYSVSGGLRFPVSQKVSMGPTAQLKGNEDYHEVKLGMAIAAGRVLRKTGMAVTAGISLQDGKEKGFAGISAWTSF